MPDSVPQERETTGGEGGPRPHSMGVPTRSSGVGAFEYHHLFLPPLCFCVLFSNYVIVRLAYIIVISPVLRLLDLGLFPFPPPTPPN